MAKYSNKVMGKEVGSGKVYAAPHTMEGKATNVKTYMTYETGAECMTGPRGQARLREALMRFPCA